jgi:hypothetical protein
MRSSRLAERAAVGHSNLPRRLVYLDDPSAGSVCGPDGSRPDGVLTVYEPELVDLLRRTGFDGDVIPVVPNVAQYVRQLSSHGMVGMALNQVRSLGPAGLLGIAWRAAPKAPRILKKDLAALLPILVDVEMQAFRRFSPPAVVLNAQLTDLAVANGNVRLVSAFARAVATRYHALAGLETYNLGLLLPWLDEWRLDVPLVVTPVNRAGFLMRPDAETCVREVETTSRRVIALQSDDDPEWDRYAAQLGITSVAFRHDRTSRPCASPST